MRRKGPWIFGTSPGIPRDAAEPVGGRWRFDDAWIKEVDSAEGKDSRAWVIFALDNTV